MTEPPIAPSEARKGPTDPETGHSCVRCGDATHCPQSRATQVPVPFLLPICDMCYYDHDDGAILPIPFYSLFGEKAKHWDFFI
jgi:hypothetical protein